jgi:hypothetical protein
VLVDMQVYVNVKLVKDLEGSGCDATEVLYQHVAECLVCGLMVASERNCLVVIFWCKNVYIFAFCVIGCSEKCALLKGISEVFQKNVFSTFLLRFG